MQQQSDCCKLNRLTDSNDPKPGTSGTLVECNHLAGLGVVQLHLGVPRSCPTVRTSVSNRILMNPTLPVHKNMFSDDLYISVGLLKQVSR